MHVIQATEAVYEQEGSITRSQLERLLPYMP